MACMKVALAIFVVFLAVLAYFVITWSRPGNEYISEQDMGTYQTSSWKEKEYKLHTNKWEPAGQPKAILYLSHGAGEHMGRYEKLKEVLVESGILVYGHDHIGHGKSEGYRVHVDTYETYTTDVIQHVEWMRGQYPDLPSFLMGHSMGGLIAVHVLLRRPELFQGAVLSSSMVEVDPEAASPILQNVAQLMGSLLPHLELKGVDPADISSIPEEVTQYVDDPHIYHGLMKAKWAAASIEAINTSRQRVGEIELPVLVMHGAQDHLVPISASEFISSNIGSSDKTYRPFEDSYHEILHDKEQESARTLIKEWLLQHL